MSFLARQLLRAGGGLKDIEFVGYNTTAANGTSAKSVSLTSLSGGSDTQARKGDIVLVAVSAAGTSDLTITINTSGYTSLGELWSDDSYDTNLEAAWKIMGGTPDTSVSVQASSGVGGVAVAVYVFRNVDQSTPMDVTPTTATGGNTADANPAAITPVTAGSVIVLLAGAADAVGAAASVNFTGGPSGTAGFTQDRSGGTNDEWAAVAGAYYTGWSSGAYDAGAFSTAGGGTDASWAAFTIALRPATA
jgi:hypothetical protein